MFSMKDFFLRAIPLAGSIILTGYCVALSREYVRRQKERTSYVESVDEAQLYSFMSKKGKKFDINNWENKRVYREWEDPSKKE
ncbi:unnamed protein product [Taenia asiatica]|uniref:Cytochrome c oxidase assembly protein COX16 homolog, mitochondrial n=1 Tax=Taenia asiatica TaxID=60517 RepID=A0A0R3W247_TAEAS|nr:unnamed protein product [Taenia asiatica]